MIVKSFDQLLDEYVKLVESSIIILSFVKKMPNGKWRVVSRKGKNLGEYTTKEEANKRLRQIEYFKHKKASNEEVDLDNYSAVIRHLRKTYDEGVVTKFQAKFKECFDDNWLKNQEIPEEDALKEALKVISSDDTDRSLVKIAAAIDLGDPEAAGKYLANIMKFLLLRIKPESRQKSINNLKHKIYYLNEFQIANKHAPASSSIGQSITICKHVLIEQSPQYIRKVLNSVVKNL